MPMDKNDQLTAYAVRARAFELWVDAGRPHGKSLALWLQAEAEITKEQETASDRMSQAPLEGMAERATR